MTDPDTCPCGRTIADDHADGKRDRPGLCIVCEVSEVCRELEPERYTDAEQAKLDV